MASNVQCLSYINTESPQGDLGKATKPTLKWDYSCTDNSKLSEKPTHQPRVLWPASMSSSTPNPLRKEIWSHLVN